VYSRSMTYDSNKWSSLASEAADSPSTLPNDAMKCAMKAQMRRMP